MCVFFSFNCSLLIFFFFFHFKLFSFADHVFVTFLHLFIHPSPSVLFYDYYSKIFLHLVSNNFYFLFMHIFFTFQYFKLIFFHFKLSVFLITFFLYFTFITFFTFVTFLPARGFSKLTCLRIFSYFHRSLL